jgi:hypothetical protein
MAAMIRKDGIKTPQMVIARTELLIDRHIMSPKHLSPGGWILVESQVIVAMISAMRTQTGVVYFGLGANRFFLNERIVISIPNTKWKYPTMKISTIFSV